MFPHSGDLLRFDSGRGNLKINIMSGSEAMNHEMKKEHLKKFNTIYFKGGKHSKKINDLPFWMENYGYWLAKEDNKRLPTYYRIFSPGTVITTDFGVRIGSEMSLQHFAVVLSKGDTQYKRNIIVVPLSSKEHRGQGYLPLGKELFMNVNILFGQKIEDISSKIIKIDNDLNAIPSKIDLRIAAEGVKFALDHNVDLRKMKNPTMDMLNYKDSSVYTTIQKIKKIPNYKSSPALVQLVNSMDREFDDSEKMIYQINNAKSEVNLLKELERKTKKYNKYTYADVANICSISKLRVKKFSNYNISENVRFNQDIVNKIKNRLQDFI